MADETINATPAPANVTATAPKGSGSMAGFDLGTWFEKNKYWFIKNKDSLKGLISGIGGLIASTWPENGFVKIAFGIGGAYITNLLISALDYFFTENPQ